MEQQQEHQATHAPEYVPNPAPVSSDAAAEHKKKAQTAMILGIIGCICVVYPVLSVAAIVLGALALYYRSEALRAAEAAGIKENGMGVAAFVTGLIGTIGGAIMTLLYLVALILFVFVVRTVVVEAGVPAIQSFFGYMDSLL